MGRPLSPVFIRGGRGGEGAGRSFCCQLACSRLSLLVGGWLASKLQIHPNTSKYIKIQSNTSNYIQIHTAGLLEAFPPSRRLASKQALLQARILWGSKVKVEKRQAITCARYAAHVNVETQLAAKTVRRSEEQMSEQSSKEAGGR